MILIANFGSQVAHLIARRLRALHVFTEIKSPEKITDEEIERAEAIILSGGPASVLEEKVPFNKKFFLSNKPLLGICYGHQLIAHELGGIVKQSNSREFGFAKINITKKNNLFNTLPNQQSVWMSHGDSVETVPHDFEIIAQSDACKAAAIAHRTKKIWGLQFHPEVHHTEFGTQILENFLTECKVTRDWQPSNLQQRLIKEIKEKVQNKHVVMGLSGGIDSLVAAYLIKQAIGNNLHCIYVDTGLTRVGDTEHVKRVCNDLQFSNFTILDARTQFLAQLKDVIDPEEKRKRIGHTFITVFEEWVKKLKQNNVPITFLGQGTIYPDTIESAQSSSTASKIKTHHNTALPETMQLQLIEPLRELYKDEVRVLAQQLQIPEEFMQRHPFPGPGLAVRIIGAVDTEKLSIVRQADHIFIQELRKSKLYNSVWQAFAALLPIKTVGVMGDERSYEYMIALRAVTSVDGMTADWAKLPNDLLSSAANRIVNEVKGVNRVVYDITQKPPATIEYE